MSRIARTTTTLALAAVLLGFPSFGQQIENPKLYGKSLTAARHALDFYGELDNPEERRRVNDVGYRLAVVSGFEEFPFHFYLVDMGVPNAFALPGGHLFVTRGMLDLGLSDDMLASLLGHELAHVIHKHGTRMQRRAALLNVLSSALMLGVLVGVDDDTADNPYEPGYGGGSRKGSMVQGTMAAGLAISELLLRNYSREFEDEADVEGQRLAAAAGFDPDGARQLWELMNSRIPQAKTYGYWRTHPFSDQRMRAAEVRAEELKIQEGKPAEDYRAAVQKAVLEYGARENRKVEDEEREKEDLFLELTALYAWPRGPRAEEIRVARLHRRRDEELERPDVERDYGELVRTWLAEIEEVRALSPESTLLATLRQELDGFRDEAEGIRGKALGIWREGIYQTPFLETFLSNYPTAAEAPEVALVLGNAYSRLGRQTEAVEQFLRAAEGGGESAARAVAGLKNLAPYLEELTALVQLAESHDPDLAELASRRLAEHSATYDELENGAEYLKRYPAGSHADAVNERLETLAHNLYGEVVLYQSVGDHVKALERIQQILTHAPLTRAAELLRDKAVFQS